MAGEQPLVNLQELTDQVCAAQRMAWEDGACHSVEYYLERYPELAGSTDELLDLIYHEICLRHESGQTITQVEYLERFPQLAGQLSDLLEVHSALDFQLDEADGSGDPAQSEADSHQETMLTARARRPAAKARKGAAPTPRDRGVGPLPERSRTGALNQGQCFGDYQLLRVIAEGGMGIVFKARQLSLRRVVALKMIRSGLFASDQEISRFESEARAAASLRHPHIVSIHEVNEAEGHRYFTMDYVEGPTLAQVIDGKPLPCRRAARYLLLIAEAVQYAHEHQVLHRDLKPSNILFDKRDEPHVADFGVSKHFNADPESDRTCSLQTQTVVGTPSYMPPEQANRQLGATSRASDVYSLGAMLYEAITGRPPFRAATPLETILQVLRQDPAPPRLLNPSLPRDLETICLKCLEKDPRRRYPTAQALADDLRRYLSDETIAARPASLVEKAWRRCRKRPGTAILATIAAGLAMFVLITSPLVTLRERSLRREADERRLAVERELRVSRAHQLTAQAQGELLEHPQRALLLGIEALEITRNSKEPIIPAVEQFLRSALQQVGGRPAPCVFEPMRMLRSSSDGQWLAAVAASDHSIRVWNIAASNPLGEPQILSGHKDEISEIQFAPDSQELISTDWNGDLRRWKLSAGKFAMTDHVSQAESLHLACYSAGGHWIAAAGQGPDVWLWRIDQAFSEPAIVLKGNGERVTHLQFHPGGKVLATAGLEGMLRLWQLSPTSAKAISLPQEEFGGPIHRAEFSGDGRFLGVAGGAEDSIEAGSILRLWRMTTDEDAIGDVQVVEDPLEVPVHDFVFRADGGQMATSSRDGALLLWELPKQGPVPPARELGMFPAGLDYLEFSGDGKWLLSVSGYKDGRQISVWWLGSERIFNPATIPCSALAVRAHFSPDSQQLVVNDFGHSVRVWDLRLQRFNWTEPRILRGHDSTIEDLTLAPGGRWMATASRDNSIRIWDVQGPLKNHSWYQYHSEEHPIVLAREQSFAQRLTVCDSTGALNSLVPGCPIQSAWSDGDHEEVLAMRAAEDGEWLLTGDGRGRIRRWQVAKDGGLRLDAESPPLEEPIVELSTSPDGQWITSVDASRRVRVWRVNSGELHQVSVPIYGDFSVTTADLSSDAAHLACGCTDGIVRVWPIRSGELQGPPRQALKFSEAVAVVAFTRDCQWLVGAGSDGTVQLQRYPGGDRRENVALPGKQDHAISLALSGNGQRLAVASLNGAVKVWRLDDPAGALELAEVWAPAGSLEQVVLSEDGSKMLVSSTSGQVKLWEIEPCLRGPILLQKDAKGIRQIGFLEKEAWAFVVGWNGSITTWNLDPAQLVAIAREAVGRSLTNEEKQEWLGSLEGTPPDAAK